MTNKDGKETLFCYRCCKHVVPIAKYTTSEYYRDVDDLPIQDILPHCEFCGHEVFSPIYYNKVNELKNMLISKHESRISASYKPKSSTGRS